MLFRVIKTGFWIVHARAVTVHQALLSVSGLVPLWAAGIGLRGVLSLRCTTMATTLDRA